MTAALSPDQAISYVRELSADVRAVVVFAADGTPLAGPPPVAAAARAFLEAFPGEADVTERTADGVVIAARTAAHAVVAVAGPLALEPLTAIDARVAAEALAEHGAPAPSPAEAGQPPSADERQRAANAVISATQSRV